LKQNYGITPLVVLSLSPEMYKCVSEKEKVVKSKYHKALYPGYLV